MQQLFLTLKNIKEIIRMILGWIKIEYLLYGIAQRMF